MSPSHKSPRRALPIVLAWIFVSALSWPGQAAELGIYFDASGSEDSRELSAFESFTFYVIAKGIGSGLRAYEFELEMSDAITILDSETHPASHLDVCDSQTCWFVGTGECYGSGGSAVLVTLVGFLTRDATNLYIRARATTSIPPSIDEDTPAYVPCGDDVVYGFDETPAAYINPSEDSFGRLKERYGG